MLAPAAAQGIGLGMTATAIDTGRLQEWMRGAVPGFRGPLSVEPMSGGQSNPTYRLAAPSGRYVLRRKPPGKLLPSAHAVDREFRVMKALHGSAVPVPRMLALCADDGVIGTMFYVMDHVEGRVLYDPRLPDQSPAERAAMFDDMNRVIAALHQVDPAKVGLGDYGKPGNYFSRQFTRWSQQYRASETETIEAMDKLIEWLPRHIPAGDETTIVHGDYRMDNLIFHPTEPRVVAVVDWELSTLGHPLGDFAYHVMSWRFTPELFRGLAGADLRALGIPEEQAYIDAYCRRTGRAGIEHWDFYMAFVMFRMAAIFQGIMGRVRDGTATDARAREAGAKARPVAELAWRQVERMQRAA
ncbi:MAG: phosphotransferase family protein [Alphaproteobacteria bacterium]|nr:phosphotransferase family protein [Alphaproteobacteria bacterium]